jgi:hypothetical protein
VSEGGKQHCYLLVAGHGEVRSARRLGANRPDRKGTQLGLIEEIRESRHLARAVDKAKAGTWLDLIARPDALSTVVGKPVQIAG